MVMKAWQMHLQSAKEFRSAVRMYGLSGDVGLLFKSLCQHSNDLLLSREVAFLDKYEDVL
eukprot:3214342-Amphidinium_carterae.1